jgi:ABC-type uncharacterized transport system ATPase subunit
MENDYMVEMRHITKSFGKLIANNDVSLKIKKGEIHALLGENGAGKSTLMNVLYGLYGKDEGTILWEGQEVSIKDPDEAIKLGIGMIHQHFMLVKKFTVLENVTLGMKEGKWIEIPVDKIRARIMELSDLYGLNIKPDAKVEDLTVGEQQRVEIVKALYRNSKLLIMDEPTAVLTPQEVSKLFEVLHKLKSEGKSILFISHKLLEALEVSDVISIMRDGCMVEEMDNHPDLDERQLANAMVGREILLDVDRSECHPGDVVLKLTGVSCDGMNVSCGVKDFSLEVHRGEIVGLAGVDGNGQTDLSELIMGLRKLTTGKIEFLGQDISNQTTKQRRELSLGYIPADRMNSAIVGELSLKMNMALNKPDKAPFGNIRAIDQKSAGKYTQEKMKEFNIVAVSDKVPAKKLSGGNQQKLVLAREVGEKVDLIIAVYPTRGLDINATHFVFETMLNARDKGTAVLYISTELEEILQLSDRIGVLYEGSLNGIMPAECADVTTIGLLMAGKKVEVFSE